jgi:ankyrin repeat protein
VHREIADNASINSKDDTGWTPLHAAAAAMDDMKEVQALVKENPVLIFSKDGDGKTPLHYAASLDSKDVAGRAESRNKWLLERRIIGRLQEDRVDFLNERAILLGCRFHGLPLWISLKSVPNLCRRF